MATNIYFGTNRQVTGGANPEIGEDFHPNLDELRFGKVSFSGKDLFKKDLDSFINSGKITPSTTPSTLRVTPLMTSLLLRVR